MKAAAALSFVLAALPAALAADCAGAKWGKPNTAVFWTAREAACFGASNTYNDARVAITYTGSGTPGDQLCWDATENIINQCISNGWQFGFYQFDGFTYKVERK